jgi:hypothetical protein
MHGGLRIAFGLTPPRTLPSLDFLLIMTLLEAPVVVVRGKQLPTCAQKRLAALPEDPISNLLAPLNSRDGAPSAIHPLGYIGLRQVTNFPPVRELRTKCPLDNLNLLRIDHEAPTFHNPTNGPIANRRRAKPP